MGTTSSSKPVLLQGASLATLHVSLFCHKSTDPWAIKPANLPSSHQLPLPRSSAWGIPSWLLHLTYMSYLRSYSAFCENRWISTGKGILSPSVLGFLKCICTRAQRQHYLVLRMMQLPLSSAHCSPVASLVFFDHSLPHTLLRLSVSKDQTSLSCIKSIFCECTDLLHEKISFVWEWRWERTALNNNKVHADLQLTFLLSVTEVRSPFANPCWSTFFSRTQRKYQMYKKQNHILPFLFLHMQDIPRESLRECVNEFSCDPGSLLPTSVILCSVPQATWPAFQRNKTVLLFQKLNSLQSTALTAICEQLSSQGRWKVSGAVQVICCLLMMLKLLWKTK